MPSFTEWFALLGYLYLALFFYLLVHELGHLVASHFARFQPCELVLGNGPRLLHVTIRGFSIQWNLVPLNGYLAHKRMHFVSTPMLTFERLGAVVEEQGILVGDRIIAVDEVPLLNWEPNILDAYLSVAQKAITIRILREGQVLTRLFSPHSISQLSNPPVLRTEMGTAHEQDLARVFNLDIASNRPPELDSAQRKQYRRISRAWQSLLVVLAGPLASFLFCIFCSYLSMCRFGTPDIPAMSWRIVRVLGESPAAEAGLKAGMLVRSIDGVSADKQVLSHLIARGDAIRVQGADFDISLKPATRVMFNDFGSPSNVQAFGVVAVPVTPQRSFVTPLKVVTTVCTRISEVILFPFSIYVSTVYSLWKHMPPPLIAGVGNTVSDLSSLHATLDPFSILLFVTTLISYVLMFLCALDLLFPKQSSSDGGCSLELLQTLGFVSERTAMLSKGIGRLLASKLVDRIRWLLFAFLLACLSLSSQTKLPAEFKTASFSLSSIASPLGVHF